MLVLQSQLWPPLTALDMGRFGTGLMSSPPGGPVQNVHGQGWRLPDKSEEQAAHFWHRERQELHRHYDAVWVGGRPLLRLRWVSCARCRTTVR